MKILNSDYALIPGTLEKEKISYPKDNDINVKPVSVNNSLGLFYLKYSPKHWRLKVRSDFAIGDYYKFEFDEYLIYYKKFFYRLQESKMKGCALRNISLDLFGNLWTEDRRRQERPSLRLLPHCLRKKAIIRFRCRKLLMRRISDGLRFTHTLRPRIIF